MLSSGQLFEGEWYHGVKEGRGSLVYPDGSSYNGYFHDGLVRAN